MKLSEIVSAIERLHPKWNAQRVMDRAAVVNKVIDEAVRHAAAGKVDKFPTPSVMPGETPNCRCVVRPVEPPVGVKIPKWPYLRLDDLVQPVWQYQVMPAGEARVQPIKAPPLELDNVSGRYYFIEAGNRTFLNPQPFDVGPHAIGREHARIYDSRLASSYDRRGWTAGAWTNPNGTEPFDLFDIELANGGRVRMFAGDVLPEVQGTIKASRRVAVADAWFQLASMKPSALESYDGSTPVVVRTKYDTYRCAMLRHVEWKLDKAIRLILE